MSQYDYSEHLRTIAWFGETDSEDRRNEYSSIEQDAYCEGRRRRFQNNTLVAAQREVANAGYPESFD